MTLDELEANVRGLRRNLEAVEEAVRLKRVAVDNIHSAVRPGDYFLSYGNLGRLTSIDSDGDWNYTLEGLGWSGRPPGDIERLFTESEVHAIMTESSVLGGGSP